jgi:hypothetical protein
MPSFQNHPTHQVEHHQEDEHNRHQHAHAHMYKQHDANVIATADDAILSKLYASKMGYYEDPFLEHFAKDAKGLTTSTATRNISTNIQFGTSFAGRSPTLSHAPQHLSASYSGQFGGSILQNPKHPEVGHPFDQNRLLGQQSHHLHPHMQNRHHGPGSMAGSNRGGCGGGGQPIIRRGSYARVCCIDKALSVFLSPMVEDNTTCSLPLRQVVMLGAGKDTSYFRYKRGILTSQDILNNISPGPGLTSEMPRVKWYDVDFESVMSKKRQLIETLPSALAKTPDTSVSTNNDDEYHMVGFDLRRPPSEFFDLLTSTDYKFDPSLPTLFVLECVQMYMTEHDSQALLSSIAQRCHLPIVVIYDPILLHDPFGNVMAQHLSRAGVLPTSLVNDNDDADNPKNTAVGSNNETSTSHPQHLSSLLATRTLEQHIAKLRQCGFGAVVGSNMANAYDTLLSQALRGRANRCEMLDEVEEWNLLMSHYCLVVACGSLVSSRGSEKGAAEKMVKDPHAHSISISEQALLRRFLQVDERQQAVITSKSAQGSNKRIGMGFVQGKCMKDSVE